MKKVITISAIIFLFLVVKTGLAQQEPLFSLYHQQLFLINPAATGSDENMQAFIDVRKQWSGIEMAPRTGAFGLHNSYSDKVGLGFLITNDRAGMIGRLSGNLNYSYKLYFSKEKKHNLVFGLGVGFIENKIDFGNAQVQDYNDPILFSDHDGFAFDARFGILYNFRGLEIGAAIPQILDNNIDYNRNGTDDFTFELKRHYIAHAGYRFSFYNHNLDDEMNKVKEAEEKFFIKPSVLYKTELSSEQIDLNIVAGNPNKYWLGFTYRTTNKSMVAQGGIQINSLGIGYAYQLPNTLPTEYSNGTHEIMLTYNIASKAKEDRKVNEKILGMNDRQNLLKSRLDKLKSDVDGIKDGEAETIGDDEIRKLEEKLQAQIDSLKDKLNSLKSSDGKIIYQDNDEELNKLKKDLNELRKNVLLIKGEKVYEIPKDKGSSDKKAIEDGCYVIVYSFRKKDNAYKGVEIANSKGYNANILYNETRKWYYIYTAKYDNLEPALKDMQQVRLSNYDDSWVHIYKK
ncbi:MAG: PorP/SprF family type IX secretion system membrane protein [Bacteroidota bacterium]|nr:PorP/SprF family type IX secretion system membrane protein [Bacteroidota bacterium]